MDSGACFPNVIHKKAEPNAKASQIRNSKLKRHYSSSRGFSAVAVVIFMEYAKENAKCMKCKDCKDLYASQCKHLDPICITCATNMAKDKTPCPTCNQIFTKVFRQYKLKPCLHGDTNKFIAKFAPKISDFVDFVGVEKQNAAVGKNNTDNKYFRKSDKRKWIMYREGAQDKRNKLKMDTTPWILENVKDKSKYRGKAKPVDTKVYYMVQFDGKRMADPLVVYPIKSWCEFESEIQYKTLTTEEAENIMKSRKRNEEGYARWMTKDKVKNDKMEDADGEHENDETRKQKQKKIEDDSDQDEEEKKSNPDENDLPKGEDWEHEEEFTDDDLSASSEDSESEGVPSDMSDFENEKVTESGEEMKNILKKERLGENDVHEPVEKAENNDASNAVNEKDLYDGKNKRKARKEDDEKRDGRNAEKPREQGQRKRKVSEEKLQDPEARQPPKKAKQASAQKSQESEAQKKEKDISCFEKLSREFLKQGPKTGKEMKSFMKNQSKGVILILIAIFHRTLMDLCMNIMLLNFVISWKNIIFSLNAYNILYQRFE